MVDEVCKTGEPIEIPAVPEQAPERGTLTKETSFQIPDQFRQPIDGVDVKVELTSVSIEVAGVPDASFIDSASVSAVMDGETQSLAWGAPNAATGNTLKLKPLTPVDVTSMLQAGSAQVTATLDAKLPRTAWTLTPTACFRGVARVAWNPKL